ncbi:MAG: hypothetical protein IT541_07360, partial [Hyphomicrobiales bacterium]|nr:hypothetical protein [Hyphomicrobiales bacterium]
MYILPTKKLTSATDAPKGVRGRKNSEQPAVRTIDEHEALEMIQRICLEVFRPKTAPVAVVKPTGRPKGSGKRKQKDGSSPERLQAIHSAVMSLIPLYTYDWTATGRPCATRIQSLTGLTDVSHWEIQLACPGYSRAKAEVRFQDSKFLGQD